MSCSCRSKKSSEKEESRTAPVARRPSSSIFYFAMLGRTYNIFFCCAMSIDVDDYAFESPSILSQMEELHFP